MKQLALTSVEELQKNEATWFDKKICCFLKKLENNHCNESLGE